ncbi:MAG TPA: LysR family transcriptional regulator [Pseudonocardia sp.]|jgi:DNA-binding transcriptional LysR family regulator|nr:LysR family transcriptional regulator [Pseudonocardia sp.]
MDVHLRDLRYFVAVAEELSFTRAASNRLFIAQPTLSKQIRQLELTMRVALFERDRRTVALTPAGAALLPRARALLDQWGDTERELAGAARCTAVTVGFQTRIGRGLIPMVTGRLERLHPEWKLLFRQVSWADPTAGLASGDVDVAVAWLPFPAGEEFTWKVVATEQRWVALPAGHRLAGDGTGSSTIPFADLVDEPFIALPASAGALRDFWLATDHRRTPPRIAAEAATADETFEAVASGLGVVLLSVGNVSVYQRADVVCRPVSGLSPSQLAVAWRTGDDRDAVRVFADACAECLCGSPSAD